MQTILGAGGAVGIELSKALVAYTPHIRLVSRHPKKVNATDELFAADLTVSEQADAAVAGSEIVYLVAGLPYKTGTWQKQWPVLMRNVLDACQKHGAKLVFFDNMYLYDAQHLHHMTEETPVQPASKKGAVRAQLVQMISDAIETKKLTAMIVRAADFIGTKNSMLVETVAKNLLKDKKANWMVDDSKVHTFTYVPDAAKATALLGNTPDAYLQTWHLPTCKERLTGKQWVALFARQTGRPPRYSVLSKNMMGLLGIFIPVLREFKEMSYQWSSDYVFDSSKFEQRFGRQPTPAAEAVKQVLHDLKNTETGTDSI